MLTCMICVNKISVKSGGQKPRCDNKHVLTDRGHRVMFAPKIHCDAKRKARATCNYSIVSLRKNIRPSLNGVSLCTIRKSFRKMRDYMRAYREGHKAGTQVESAVKNYKSHTRPVQLDTLHAPL